MKKIMNQEGALMMMMVKSCREMRSEGGLRGGNVVIVLLFC